MKLFALDLGNRQVKLMSEKGTKVLPSYFVDVEEYGKRDVLAIAKSDNTPKTRDYVSQREPEFTYVWGEGLHISGKHLTDTLRFNNRYDSLEFKLLADFALAEISRDFKESTKGILEVVVVTGVPTDDYEKDDTITNITKALKGVHSATIDGVSHVVRVNEVYVLMQPTGTAINEMVDDFGNVIDDTDIEEGYVGIVDVGGGTLIIDAFDEMNLDTKNRVQMKEGAYSLYTAIRNRVKDYSMSEYEVERVVRNGNDREIYTWSPNGREKIDLTSIVMTERKRYTRKIAQSIKTAYKDIGRMKTIYLTGGTTNLLIREEIEPVLPNVRFVEDSEVANVRGFYKYGLINEVTNVGGEEAQVTN